MNSTLYERNNYLIATSDQQTQFSFTVDTIKENPDPNGSKRIINKKIHQLSNFTGTDPENSTNCEIIERIFAKTYRYNTGSGHYGYVEH